MIIPSHAGFSRNDLDSNEIFAQRVLILHGGKNALPINIYLFFRNSLIEFS